MEKQEPKAEFLFEVSYEVCNKVGGIYRVMESKANNMIEKYGENYYLIGPHYLDKNKGEFKKEAPPAELKKAFQELEKEGIKCHYGRWMVGGKPKTILVDFNDFYYKSNQIKKEFWEDYGIDSLGAGNTFDEPIVWSWATGMLIEKINQYLVKDKKAIAHFHEWLSGAGLLYLKKYTEIPTVFTTHATSLGRALAYNDVNFYTLFDKINPSEAAYENNVHSKHQLEKKTAQQADVFTTVSEITGIETDNFLGRSPDVVLSNGLDLDKFLTFEEIVIKHRLQRRRLREFTISFFFPYYKFDIENTLFYFIIGRNEYRAKGVDIFIKSLAELNEKLKKNKDNKKTIVAYFWIPSDVRSVKTELVENEEFFEDVKDSLSGAMPDVEEKILYNLLYDKEITKKNIIAEDYLFEIEKKLLRMDREESEVPISTHELADSENRIVNTLRENGLTNKKEDPVKVIYYPIYLTGHDGLSNLSYQEALEACHLGVFPSFYEPWGYTPLEAAALGVASVTTDLAGFGRYRQTLKEKEGKEGVYVLERLEKSDNQSIHNLADFMHKFSSFNRQGRVDNKIEARKIASKADWKDFVENYIKAHNQVFNDN
jgi:glycogen(starch) synthase